MSIEIAPAIGTQSEVQEALDRLHDMGDPSRLNRLEAIVGDHRYVATGVWSIGKREIDYVHAEFAGMDARFAVQEKVLGVEVVAKAKGEDAPELLAYVKPSFDGGGYRETGKLSIVTVYRAPADVPVRLVYGTQYTTSRGGPRGQRKVVYGPDGIDSFAQYRRANANLAIPSEVLEKHQKFVEQQKAAQEARREAREMGYCR